MTSMVIDLYIFRLWKQDNFLKVICTTILVITNKFIVLPKQYLNYVSFTYTAQISIKEFCIFK